MDPFNIVEIDEHEGGWEATVEVGRIDVEEDQRTINVNIDKDTFERLTDGQIDVERLVEITMEYLLTKETKDTIQPEFDLDEISTLLPGFEDEVYKVIHNQNDDEYKGAYQS